VGARSGGALTWDVVTARAGTGTAECSAACRALRRVVAPAAQQQARPVRGQTGRRCFVTAPPRALFGAISRLGHTTSPTPALTPTPRSPACVCASSYVRLHKVGQGTYSSVYKAVDQATGGVVALKKVRLDVCDEEAVLFAIREVRTHCCATARSAAASPPGATPVRKRGLQPLIRAISHHLPPVPHT
jgi:hypothetical protein